MLKRFIDYIILFFVLCLVYWPSIIIAGENMNIHLEPKVISIGATYNGGNITVSGHIPKDSEVLIQLIGKTVDTVLLKKGRVLGVLWMNTGTITVKNSPKVYTLYLPSSMNASTIDQWKDLNLGFRALKNLINITPDDEDKDLQFNEFIKLKKHEGMYSINENAITYQPLNGTSKNFLCQVAVPCAISPGEYGITAYLIKDKKVVQKDEHQFKIVETGFPAIISSLAYEHGALYGILASIIALAAGLLMGFLFKGGKGAH